METKKVLKFFAAWSLEKEEAFFKKNASTRLGTTKIQCDVYV